MLEETSVVKFNKTSLLLDLILNTKNLKPLTLLHNGFTERLHILIFRNYLVIELKLDPFNILFVKVNSITCMSCSLKIHVNVYTEGLPRGRVGSPR